MLIGPEGLARKLAVRLSRPDCPINPGVIEAQLIANDSAQAAADFNKLMSRATAQALEPRLIGDKDARAPAPLLAIDQAEELFASENEILSERFLFLLGNLLHDPPADVEPFALFTIRSDSAARLFQMISDMKLEFPETLPLLPLPRTSYRDVILKPLEVIARRGQRLAISPELSERLVDDATGADALPLLAFTLSHLYQEFSAGGTITLGHYEAMGGVAGSIELALKRALAKPGNVPVIPGEKKDQLACMRAAFIPWLARINPESGQPMRRVARMDEFSKSSRAVVERLIEARLLIADRRADANVVEIAHESLLRQWPELIEWLKADAEDLKLVDAVELAANEWARKERHQDWLEHRGSRLRAAERVATREDFCKRLGEDGLAYLRACRASEQERKLKLGAVVGSLLTLLIAGGVAWRYQDILKEDLYWLAQVRGYVLSPTRERVLNEFDHFKECANCPEMIVMPAGTFMMGSPEGLGDKSGREYPSHKVTIPSKFAVAKSEVTFFQFDDCADYGDCNSQLSSNSHDDKPAVNVTWHDAQHYAAWLARITGKPYRLLSEAEYEYAARGGTQSQYPWGDEIGAGTANCGECGGKRTDRGTTPVGSFPANQFGLFDMVGNVYEWVQDCFHDSYAGAPANGSAWSSENCPRRVVRGGSWLSRLNLLRSAWRDWRNVNDRKDDVGFRVARTIAPQ